MRSESGRGNNAGIQYGPSPFVHMVCIGLVWNQKDPGHNMEWGPKQHEREYLGDALYHRNILNIEFN